MKKIVIESLISSQKTAILEDDNLTEVFIEDNKKSKTVSNIYRGIVKKVLPGIEACFIDVGLEKLAYLQLKKDNNIKAGQEILVQINKEEIGSKGAKLNLEISLAGRYLVYIPSNDRITISNKIRDEKERFRLKKIAKSISKDNSGLIIRTESVGCSKEDLENDINELHIKYENILKEYKLGMGPKLLYKELDFSSKYIKDNINEDIELIVVNNKDKYDELKDILKSIKKEYIEKLKLEENKDIFNLYKVDSQIEKALNKKVWLKSGGYLIIEKTEALTVIDVNTGKFTGNLKLEDTVYKTNIEAAIEIARQLKLRDIGGIIIIDFIDMHKDKHKKELLKILDNEMSKDKRKYEVLGITRLGLVEVARRREKDSLAKYYLEECNECKNTGFIKSINSVIDNIEKEIIRIKEHTTYKNITIKTSTYIYKEIKKNFEYIIEKISIKYDVLIKIEEDEKINSEKINIIYNS
ncbi:Rne/Rng family ribonuclease [Romboutsia lituseburensis]|uniref:Rne/Rng family ribonuclease n=1 Tax=Romboutsia lituseburensis TaxID=1537 RepID=UPI00215A2790|nr:Rne/Rng family ribonuclease [Romboutsia lituseburensis]MCR8746512.1 Rne/Rng family ribonuclease [Romboutsia lituseburensis]